MFIVGGVAALIVWCLRHSLPESPRWYESRGELNKAEEIMSKVERYIEVEQGIKLSPVEGEFLESTQVIKKVAFWSLFKGALLKRTIVASAVLIGMNTIIYTIVNWVPTIFVQSGISVTKSMGMMALIMVGAPIGVFIASQIMDKFPRKGMAVTLLLIIGMLGYVYSLQRSETLIVIFGFALTVVIYIYTCLACAVYVPEMWPTEARLRGVGVANAIGRVSAIFSPYGVAWLLSNYGSIAVFIGLGGVLVLLALIIATLNIETRYKSLEEISKEVGI